MTTYCVSVPVAGSFTVWVTAETEQEAIGKAESCGLRWSIEVEQEDRDSGIQDVELGEEFHYGQIVEGNIFCGPTNHTEVVDIEDDDETEADPK